MVVEAEGPRKMWDSGEGLGFRGLKIPCCFQCFFTLKIVNAMRTVFTLQNLTHTKPDNFGKAILVKGVHCTRCLCTHPATCIVRFATLLLVEQRIEHRHSRQKM